MIDITGRDRHIITTALAIAIEAINVLPPAARPESDQRDMKKLLAHLVEDDLELANVAESASLRMGSLRPL